MPNRSPEGVQFYKFPQTFFIRGEWNTFSSSPSRTFKQGKVLSLEPFFNCPVKVKYEKKWQGVVMETFKQGRKNIMTDDMLKTDKILHLSSCFVFFCGVMQLTSAQSPPLHASLPVKPEHRATGLAGCSFMRSLRPLHFDKGCIPPGIFENISRSLLTLPPSKPLSPLSPPSQHALSLRRGAVYRPWHSVQAG